jgi:DNA-binding response OmpR family regulator
LILVVEDEALIAMETAAVLTAHGFAVLGPVATVAGALELLRREQPDAAVLDVNLRGVAVTPVATELRAMGVPFLLASAYRSDDLPREPVLRDAVNVGKPIQAAVVVEMLQRLMRGQARQE